MASARAVAINQLRVKFYSKWQEIFAQIRKARKEMPIDSFLNPRLEGFLGVLCGFARDAFSFKVLASACPV